MTQPFAIPAEGGVVHNVLGAPYRFLVTSEQSAGAFALIESTAAPGSGVPPHVHEREDETFYVLEGTFEATCGGKTFSLSPNSTVFLPRRIPHSYRNPTDKPTRYLVLITPGGFEKCLEEFGKMPANEPPSMETLAKIGRKYGLEFVAPAS